MRSRWIFLYFSGYSHPNSTELEEHVPCCRFGKAVIFNLQPNSKPGKKSSVPKEGKFYPSSKLNTNVRPSEQAWPVHMSSVSQKLSYKRDLMQIKFEGPKSWFHKNRIIKLLKQAIT